MDSYALITKKKKKGSTSARGEHLSGEISRKCENKMGLLRPPRSTDAQQMIAGRGRRPCCWCATARGKYAVEPCSSLAAVADRKRALCRCLWAVRGSAVALGPGFTRTAWWLRSTVTPCPRVPVFSFSLIKLRNKERHSPWQQRRHTHTWSGGVEGPGENRPLSQQQAESNRKSILDD